MFAPAKHATTNQLAFYAIGDSTDQQAPDMTRAILVAGEPYIGRNPAQSFRQIENYIYNQLWIGMFVVCKGDKDWTLVLLKRGSDLKTFCERSLT